MELRIDSASAMGMAETIFGAGITILGASFTGQSNQVGLYSGAWTTMPGVAPSDAGLILSTGRVADFTQSAGDANVSEATSTDFAKPGDMMLSTVSGQPTFDAAVFTSSFVPTGDTLTMQLVWSSEEYLEYVNKGFNDAFAVWVNGVPAALTIGSGAITIDNINTVSNQNLYIDNPAATNSYNTEMDGFTVTLTLKAPVIPNTTNSFRLAIADSGDGVYDSAVLIAAQSVQVALIAGDDVVTVRKGDVGRVDVLANDLSSSAGVLTITRINGVDVSQGSVVALPTGDVVTVLAGGVLSIQSAGHRDDHVLTYEVRDSTGTTDVAFVTVNIVACFTAGTQIAVPGGQVAVERLRVGDLVSTRDHGPQVLRWLGCRSVPARGADAPVEISAGTFGAHGTLRLSPNHRVLIEGARAELLFGEAEVLVKAKHLLDDVAVRRVEGGEVTYLHLLFDRHEVVMAEGLAVESYFPGPATLPGHDAETQAEVLRLFPALAADPRAYGRLARPELKAHEVPLLQAG